MSSRLLSASVRAVGKNVVRTPQRSALFMVIFFLPYTDSQANMKYVTERLISSHHNCRSETPTPTETATGKMRISGHADLRIEQRVKCGR